MRDANGVHAPGEVWVDVDSDGIIVQPETMHIDKGWELLTGFSNQYGYNGAILHPSEVIGDGLELCIRSRPELYAAVKVNGGEEFEGDSWVGWAVAYRNR